MQRHRLTIHSDKIWAENILLKNIHTLKLPRNLFGQSPKSEKILDVEKIAHWVSVVRAQARTQTSVLVRDGANHGEF